MLRFVQIYRLSTFALVEGQKPTASARVLFPFTSIYKMNELIIFQSSDFGQIRTAMDENGEPLFCLADVCKALELRAPDVKRRLDDAVVSTHTVVDSRGRKNKLSFVNEDGLYDVILDSRKAEARQFRKWVTSEVLPEIRMTGGYIPVGKDDDEDAIQRKAIDIMNRTIEQMKQKEILRLADNIIGEGIRMLNEGAEDTLTATQVAKTFNMTVFHFNEVLRDLGIQYRRHGHWNISDDLANRDFVRMRTHVSYSLKGLKKVKHYMTWTMDGLHYLNARLGYPNL